MIIPLPSCSKGDLGLVADAAKSEKYRSICHHSDGDRVGNTQSRRRGRVIGLSLFALSAARDLGRW